MGIREKMNQNPAIVTGVTAGIIVIALILILYQLFGGDGAPSPVTKAWYTIDDGASFFSDDLDKIPPFQKDGKDAYGAEVFTCDGGSTKFVAYIFRFPQDAKAKIEAARVKVAAAPKNAPALNEIDLIDNLQANAREVKAPKTGDAGWLKQSDKRAAKILSLNCPGGAKIEDLEQVQPE